MPPCSMWEDVLKYGAFCGMMPQAGIFFYCANGCQMPLGICFLDLSTAKQLDCITRPVNPPVNDRMGPISKSSFLG